MKKIIALVLLCVCGMVYGQSPATPEAMLKRYYELLASPNTRMGVPLLQDEKKVAALEAKIEKLNKDYLEAKKLNPSKARKIDIELSDAESALQVERRKKLVTDPKMKLAYQIMRLEDELRDGRHKEEPKALTRDEKNKWKEQIKKLTDEFNKIK